MNKKKQESKKGRSWKDLVYEVMEVRYLEENMFYGYRGKIIKNQGVRWIPLKK